MWNGVAAVVTAYFGARCVRNPDHRFLWFSTLWGAFGVILGIAQVAGGAAYWLYYLVLVLSGVAGMLSFVARDVAPDPPSGDPTVNHW